MAHAPSETLHHRSKRPRDDEEPGFERSLSPLRGKDSTRRPDLTPRLSTLSASSSANEDTSRPALNIVIMLIGSRGDLQPFLKIGKLLKDHGHRVRIATHPVFKKFVEQYSGLEFFSVGGDPVEIVAFNVKDPGLIPSVSAARSGGIGRVRDTIFESFKGSWKTCINATDDEAVAANLEAMEGKNSFVADAIIANPGSYAHIHCAERLGVPVHLMCTSPCSPTQQFRHPLANSWNSSVDIKYPIFMSYWLVEMMYVESAACPDVAGGYC